MALESKVLILSTLFFSLVHLSFVVGDFNFPPPVQKCRITDEKCMIEQANNFLRAYPHGYAELGLLDLEPFIIDKLEILGDTKSAANINLYMSDLKFYNYSTLTFTKLRGFSKDTSKPLKIISQSFIPTMTLKAKYKISGKILVLPINGEGDLEWIISGTEVRSRMVLSPQPRDGKTWLKITEYKVVSKIKNVKIDMTNLFNGDKALSENMLKLLNENSQVLSEEITPQIDEAMTQKHRTFMENLFENVPYEDYFLPEA